MIFEPLHDLHDLHGDVWRFPGDVEERGRVAAAPANALSWRGQPLTWRGDFPTWR
jgi:hypothetical protein